MESGNGAHDGGFGGGGVGRFAPGFSQKNRLVQTNSYVFCFCILDNICCHIGSRSWFDHIDSPIHRFPILKTAKLLAFRFVEVYAEYLGQPKDLDLKLRIAEVLVPQIQYNSN